MRLFWAIMLLCLLPACDERTDTEIIPLVFVEEDLNLNNVEFNALRLPNGFVYLNAGFRGIIVVHAGGGAYRAFERACPHDPRSNCPPVRVDDSGLFMVHDCCSSTFSFQGDVTGGPSRLPMLQYATTVSGNYLFIRNQ